MKKLALVLLLPIFLLLVACPYKSSSAIDEGSYKVPKWIIGKWINKSGTKYEIEQDPDSKYAIKAFIIDSLGNKTDKYEYAIISKVGKEAYFNVKVSGGTGYYLFKLNKVSKKEFELWPIREKAYLPADMKKHLKNNAGSTALFDMSDIYTYNKIK